MEGTGVVDGYYWPPSEVSRVFDESIILKIKKGKVIGIEGCPVKSKILEEWFKDQIKFVKHFCIGFNPGARLSGKINEAERVYGTISIGIGNYPYHTDGIIKKPTIMLDDVCIEKDGVYQTDKLLALEKKLSRNIGVKQ